jgi:hypothetical protein
MIVPELHRTLLHPEMIGWIGIQIVFTVYMNIGVTVQRAWQIWIAIALSILPVHALAVMMPGGATGERYLPWVCHVTLIFGVVLGVGLNCSYNAKIFFVWHHVDFMMEFMNPKSERTFGRSWGVDQEAYTTLALFSSNVGMLISVFVMIFPLPVRSSDASRELAVDTVKQATDCVEKLVECYCAPTPPGVRIVRCEVDAFRLDRDVKNMTIQLDGYWWEAFDCGRAGLSRALLKRHQRLMRNLSDMIFSLQVCVIREEYEPIHGRLMARVAPELKNMTETCAGLLRLATLCCINGHTSPEQVESMRSAMKQAQDAARSLSAAFDSARKVESPNKPIARELQSECFFVYLLSAYCRQILVFSEDVLDRPPERGTPELPRLSRVLLDNFVALFDPSVLFRSAYLDHAVRNVMAIIIAFYFGMWCMSHQPFNSHPAGTVAVLLSNFSGSAMQRNMGRMQAVTLAAILPRIFVNALGPDCTWNHILFQVVGVFCYEGFSCYMYFSSSANSYFGLLLAGLGFSALIYPCSGAEDYHRFGVQTFQKILNTTLAVVIITLVDLCLSVHTAAEKTTSHYLQAMLDCDTILQSCLARRDADGRALEGEMASRDHVEVIGVQDLHLTDDAMLSRLNEAEAMGEEASKEPRYQKADWPDSFFNSILRLGYTLRANFHEIDGLLSVEAQSGTFRSSFVSSRKYNDVFMHGRGLQEFDSMKGDMIDMMDCLLISVKCILQNDKGRPLYKLRDYLLAKERNGRLRSIDEFIDAVSKKKVPELQYPTKVADNLEEDLICRFNAATMLLADMADTIDEALKECIKQLADT